MAETQTETQALRDEVERLKGEIETSRRREVQAISACLETQKANEKWRDQCEIETHHRDQLAAACLGHQLTIDGQSAELSTLRQQNAALSAEVEGLRGDKGREWRIGWDTKGKMPREIEYPTEAAMYRQGFAVALMGKTNIRLEFRDPDGEWQCVSQLSDTGIDAAIAQEPKP